MGKTRKPYPPEYKERIIELLREGRSPGELAKEFEPSTQTIRNWWYESLQEGGVRTQPETDQLLAEVKRVRQENKRLRQEREILAKAAAWFAQETNTVPPKSTGS